MEDSFLCLYMLLPRLDSNKYLVFLAEVLPELLIDVPVPDRCRMWFQQDGVSSLYGSCVSDHLDRKFSNKWIGRGSLIAWPPRSLD